MRTIPYVQPEEFDQAPILLSTNPAENRLYDCNAISEAWHELNITSHESPALLLMTDAVGRWLLDQDDSDRVSVLLDIPDLESFSRFVEHERAEGRMRSDDATLVVVG